jgi:hypothetical protein
MRNYDSCPRNLPKVHLSNLIHLQQAVGVRRRCVAPALDMVSTTMEADSTARAPKKQLRCNMRCAQYADATQQPSAIINRRVLDKTHTRLTAPDLCGYARGRKWATCARPPPLAGTRSVCVCLLLQDLVQTCLHGGGGIWEDMCYERRRAEACVD